VEPREPEFPVELVAAGVPPGRPAAVREAEPRGAARPAPNPLAPATIVAAPPAPATTQSGGARVERIAVCMGVRDRNPANEVSSVPATAGKVYCWFRISGASGARVRTVWFVNGRRQNGSWMTVGGNTWRTWAWKKLEKSTKGAARVEVQDEKGTVLASRDFTITSR
jgi:hypothetical protein